REAAIDAILQNENIIVGTLMAVLSDRSVQEVLGLPSDFSVESYIVRLRRAIRDSADLTSFRGTAAVSSAVSEVEPAMFCDVAVCIAVAAVAIISVVVHTAATVVNYVAAYAVVRTTVAFTVSGAPPYGPGPSTQPSLNATAISNETTQGIWGVVMQGNRMRRIFVEPFGSLPLNYRHLAIVVVIPGEGNLRFFYQSGEEIPAGILKCTVFADPKQLTV